MVKVFKWLRTPPPPPPKPGDPPAEEHLPPSPSELLKLEVLPLLTARGIPNTLQVSEMHLLTHVALIQGETRPGVSMGKRHFD